MYRGSRKHVLDWTARPDSPADVVIATWNLAAPRSPSVRRRQEHYIAQVAPDVWVFTEGHDLIATGHAHMVSSTGGRDHDEDLQTRWVAISSDSPLEPLEVSDPVRSAAARVHPKEKTPFVVFGTVLPWLGSAWQVHAAAEGAAFEAALELQADDWETLMARYQEEEFVLAGDFNQDLAESHFYGSRKNRELLRRTLEQVGLVALTGGDMDPIRRDSPPRACIDHICVRADSTWRAVEIERWPDSPVPDRRLSDHFGVKVTLARSPSR